MIDAAADVLIILFSFTVFALIHSLTATNKVKKFLTERYGKLIAFYRMAYVFFSLITFYILYNEIPHPILTIYDLPYPFDFIVLIPQFLSLIGILWTLKYFDIREFLGINQIFRWFNKEYNVNELDEKMTFNFNGPYKICRHPLYLFSIIFLICRAEMDLFYLTLLISIIVYFYIGSFFEEKRLVEKFGDEYLKYQDSVPRILPIGYLITKYKS